MDLPTFLKYLFGLPYYDFLTVDKETKTKYGWYINHILSKKLPTQSAVLSRLSPDMLVDAWWGIVGNTKSIPSYFYNKNKKDILSDSEREILEDNDIEITPYIIDNINILKSDIMDIEKHQKISNKPPIKNSRR